MKPEFAPHLDNIINGGLMKRVTPPEVEQQLIQSGYARRGVGGLVATYTGHKALKDYWNAKE